MDLADFFPSIAKPRVIKTFRRFGYPKNISFYLASICCVNNSLPQGASTSPILSNIIAKRFDKRLFALAKKYNLKYTRYADDLTFSGIHIPLNFLGIVEDIMDSLSRELSSKSAG